MIESNNYGMATFKPILAENSPEAISNYYQENGLEIDNPYLARYLSTNSQSTELAPNTANAPLDIIGLLGNPKFASLQKKPTTDIVEGSSNVSIDLNDPLINNAVNANIMKESGGIPQSEGLNYKSTDRIREVFGKRVVKLTDVELGKYVNNPTGLANFVYGPGTAIGKSMGNLGANDGWNYRGRGFIQLTGKNNYSYYGKKLGLNLVGNPDLANDPKIAAKITEAFIREGLKGKSIPKTQREANRLVTQIIGGGGLNLNSGYGAKLLSKVNKHTNS